MVIDLASRRTASPVRRTFEPVRLAVERCRGCSLCISVCPHHVLAIDTGVVNPLGYHAVHLTDASACTSCALCARICPDAVFTVDAPARTAGS